MFASLAAPLESHAGGGGHDVEKPVGRGADGDLVYGFQSRHVQLVVREVSQLRAAHDEGQAGIRQPHLHRGIRGRHVQVRRAAVVAEGEAGEQLVQPVLRLLEPVEGQRHVAVRLGQVAADQLYLCDGIQKVGSAGKLLGQTERVDQGDDPVLHFSVQILDGVLQLRHRSPGIVRGSRPGSGHRAFLQLHLVEQHRHAGGAAADARI